MDDVEKIKARLAEMGVNLGGAWQQTRERENVESPLMKRQKAALRQMERLLVQQVADDQKRAAELASALQRLKHGGGQ